MVKTEDDALDPTPVASMRETSAAMTYLDDVVTAAGGIALRYGGFYGAANDGLIQPVRKRQFPIVGSGGGVSSFVHLDDAAAATVLALEHDGPAIYNVVDDEPRACARVAAGACRRPRSEVATSLPRMARTGHRGRGGSDAGDGGPRRLQREGKARARLDAAPHELAHGVRRGLREGGGRVAVDADPDTSQQRSVRR